MLILLEKHHRNKILFVTRIGSFNSYKIVCRTSLEQHEILVIKRKVVFVFCCFFVFFFLL